MHTYLRNRPPWIQLIIFGGLTGGIFVASIYIGTGIVAQANHMNFSQIASMTITDYARPELAGVIKGLLIVQFFGLFFLPSLVFAYLTDPKPLAYAGLKPPERISFLFIGLLTMAAAYFMVEWMVTLNEELVLRTFSKSAQDWIQKGEEAADNTLKNILTMKGPADLLFSIFLVGILPAIGEELFFRGILQKIFIQIFKKAWPGIIFTAALFSAFHGQFMGFIPRMAMGIVLGALYWFSGSIFVSMIGHFIFNTINVLLIYFKIAEMDSKTSSGWVISLTGLASMVIVILLIKYLRNHSSTSFEKEFLPEGDIKLFDESDGSV